MENITLEQNDNEIDIEYDVYKKSTYTAEDDHMNRIVTKRKSIKMKKSDDIFSLIKKVQNNTSPKKKIQLLREGKWANLVKNTKLCLIDFREIGNPKFREKKIIKKSKVINKREQTELEDSETLQIEQDSQPKTSQLLPQIQPPSLPNLNDLTNSNVYPEAKININPDSNNNFLLRDSHNSNNINQINLNNQTKHIQKEENEKFLPSQKQNLLSCIPLVPKKLKIKVGEFISNIWLKEETFNFLKTEIRAKEDDIIYYEEKSEKILIQNDLDVMILPENTIIFFTNKKIL